ncbi:MAG TPA: hypothetical protein VES42_24000 [Pilimelia sp.]|nr:hypothetical protein [Pilimelia sp.]
MVEPTSHDRTDAPATGADPAGPPGFLGPSLAERALILACGLGLGLLAGYLLPRVVAWAVTVPWVPMKGPLELLASLDDRWVAVGSLLAGPVVGLGLGWLALVTQLTVTVTAQELTLTRDDRRRTVARADIDAVFLDGKALVVLDRESRQVVREAQDRSAARVAAVFQAYGYPWLAADPYAELYRRWVRDSPELPPAANAVLTAREAALRRKVVRDITELRDEVQKLGFVVRDDGVRQYWRPLVRS